MSRRARQAAGARVRPRDGGVGGGWGGVGGVASNGRAETLTFKELCRGRRDRTGWRAEGREDSTEKK